jgi:Tfp pilus assembly protein FimT
MRPLAVRNPASYLSSLCCGGFTAIELAVIVVVVGILAAISAPSMIGWTRNVQVEDAVDRLEGALKEAQREAVKRTTDCEVIIPIGTSTNLASSSTNCLISGDRSFNQITLALATGSSTSAMFNHKGRQTNSQLTVLVSNSQSPSTLTRCLVASQGLGVIRTGIWDGATSSCNIRR